jgi:hypothetical protein
MDEQSNRSTDPSDAGASTGGTGADESWGWNAEGPESSSPGGTADRIVSQLQQMIDTIATQAAPVARQIGAKAAELAALAADRAGPIAHKAADATADASVKIAERSRVFAADLRREMGSTDGGGTSSGSVTSGSTTVIDGVDDQAEQSAKDDPAEGAVDASGTDNRNLG